MCGVYNDELQKKNNFYCNPAPFHQFYSHNNFITIILIKEKEENEKHNVR